jgi:hypothetical protein
MEAAKEHAFRMYGLAGQTAVVTGGTKVRHMAASWASHLTACQVNVDHV